MKRLIRYLIITIILLSNSSVFAQNNFPQDINGWQNAKWGMNEQELINTFGSQLTKLSKKEKYAGTHTNFVINNYLIEDIKFRVSFRMSDYSSKLVEVAISNVDKNTLKDTSKFNNLASLLVRKYGQGQRETNDNDKQTLEWIFPSTSIILSYSYFTSFHMDSLSIRYISNKNGEINKL